ncbi:hypothetical protein [Haladaptatus sp. NG-WS-4]
MVWKSKTRRSVVLAALLVLSAMSVGLVNAASLDGTLAGEDDSAVQANGDDVYIVFGADTSSTDLETWVENHEE